jgi:hypothetical protein
LKIITGRNKNWNQRKYNSKSRKYQKPEKIVEKENIKKIIS